MEKLKDVEVVERHVACYEPHAAELYRSLDQRKVCYSVEEHWEPCERCAHIGLNIVFLVVDGPGLTKFQPNPA